MKMHEAVPILIASADRVADPDPIFLDERIWFRSLSDLICNYGIRGNW